MQPFNSASTSTLPREPSAISHKPWPTLASLKSVWSAASIVTKTITCGYLITKKRQIIWATLSSVKDSSTGEIQVICRFSAQSGSIQGQSTQMISHWISHTTSQSLLKRRWRIAQTMLRTTAQTISRRLSTGWPEETIFSIKCKSSTGIKVKGKY